MIEVKLKDDLYPYLGVTHTRNIARAFVLNENNEIALHVIKRNDIFGKEIYYETPGGGIEKHESASEAIIRECDEELGYKVEIVNIIGTVEDYYNILFRKNIQTYFLCRIESKTKKHFVSLGDSLIKDTIWVKPEEALKLYEENKVDKIARLVARKETIILKEVIKMLNEAD